MTLILDFFRKSDSLKQYTRFQVKSRDKQIRSGDTKNMIFELFIVTLYSDVS